MDEAIHTSPFQGITASIKGDQIEVGQQFSVSERGDSLVVLQQAGVGAGGDANVVGAHPSHRPDRIPLCSAHS
jgi:hypothetical protein